MRRRRSRDRDDTNNAPVPWDSLRRAQPERAAAAATAIVTSGASMRTVVMQPSPQVRVRVVLSLDEPHQSLLAALATFRARGIARETFA